MNYGTRRDETNIYAFAIGTIDGEQVEEIVSLPKTFTNTEAIDALAERVWWLTPEELSEVAA